MISVALKMDKICKKIEQAKTHHRQRSLWKAKARIWRKVKHLKTDLDSLHCQTTAYLVKNFDVIIIPPFKATDMSKRILGRSTGKWSFTEIDDGLGPYPALQMYD
jgi:putative transposase